MRAIVARRHGGDITMSRRTRGLRMAAEDRKVADAAGLGAAGRPASCSASASAKFGVLPAAVSNVMAQAGGAIFGNLPLIFAIGVALGLTNNDGVAALAAVVGYAVMLATMGVMAAIVGLRRPSRSWASRRSRPACSAASWSAPSRRSCSTATIRIKLPAYLGFFAGKRSVPILTAFAAVVRGHRCSASSGRRSAGDRRVLALGRRRAIRRVAFTRLRLRRARR